jgi:hypothetical protein
MDQPHVRERIVVTDDRRDGGTEFANVVIMLDADAESGAPVDWVHLQGGDRDAVADIDRAIAALTKTRQALVAGQQDKAAEVPRQRRHVRRGQASSGGPGSKSEPGAPSNIE